MKIRVGRHELDIFDPAFGSLGFPLLVGQAVLQGNLLHSSRYLVGAPRVFHCHHATEAEERAFSEQYPEAQLHFPIVGLGSLKRIGQSPGVDSVLMLSCEKGKPTCSWVAANFGWSDVFRFLTISPYCKDEEVKLE